MTPISPRMRFGDYEAVQFIAAGGMGETWAGVKLSLTRAVAIKVLHPNLVHDGDAQTRFVREARISAALQHARIVSVLDYGTQNGFLYLVMERVDGVDVRTFLRAFRKTAKLEDLPPTLVGHIVGEVLEALRYAHTRSVGGRSDGVIHRDITPGNVLVSSEGEVFVTDFGIARYVADSTLHRHIVGSLRYMAPEQAEGQATVQSDIFGVGALAYYLLTGNAPLDIKTPLDFAVAYRHAIPRIERDDVPPPLQEFLARSLAFPLEDRFETADDALAVLDELASYGDDKRNSTVLRNLYRSCVARPKSHVTGYLQREDAGASFLLPLYWEQAEGRPPTVKVPPVAAPSTTPTSLGPPSDPDDAEDSEDSEEGMPWLRDGEDVDPSASVDVGNARGLDPAGKGSTMVLPQRGADSVPVPRNRVIGTLPIRSSVGGPEENAPSPKSTAYLPCIRGGTAPMAAASPHVSTPRPVEVSAITRPPTHSVLADVRALASPDPGRRSPWLVMAGAALALSLVNLGFVIFGSRGPAGIAVGDPTTPAPSTVAADLDCEEPVAVASGRVREPAASDAALVSTEPPESQEPAAAESHPLPPERTNDPAPTPSAEPEPVLEPKPKPKPEPKPRVMVLFFLKGASYGEVRIAGRTVAVETVATLELRPGHYATQWRRRGETEWHSSGKIKIPALDSTTQYCEVRLEDGGHQRYERLMASKRGAP